MFKVNKKNVWRLAFKRPIKSLFLWSQFNFLEKEFYFKTVFLLLSSRY